MATSSTSTTLTEPSPMASIWTIKQLKFYLQEKELPISGQKNELVRRVIDFQEVEALQDELGALAFQNLSVPAPLPFESLLNSDWSIDYDVQQTFPTNTSYTCPGSPSLILLCRFPAGGSTVLWSFPGSTKPDGFAGHEVNSSIGVSQLKVINSMHLKEEYHCITFFNNTYEDLTVMPKTPPTDLLLNDSRNLVSAKSIQIKWVNHYPECFNYSVFAAGKVHTTISAVEGNYVIQDLEYNTPYNVCLMGWDTSGNTDRNWTFCESISTDSICSDGTIGTVVCIVVPVVSCCGIALVVCLVLICVIVRYCCRREIIPDDMKQGRIEDSEKCNGKCDGG